GCFFLHPELLDLGIELAQRGTNRCRPGLSFRGQVLLGFGEGPAPALRVVIRRRSTHQAQNLLADSSEVQAKIQEYLRGQAFLLAQEAKQEMRRPDVGVPEVPRLFEGVLEDALETRRLRRPASDHIGSSLRDALHLPPNAGEIQAKIAQNLGGNA